MVPTFVWEDGPIRITYDSFDDCGYTKITFLEILNTNKFRSVFLFSPNRKFVGFSIKEYNKTCKLLTRVRKNPISNDSPLNKLTKNHVFHYRFYSKTKTSLFLSDVPFTLYVNLVAARPKTEFINEMEKFQVWPNSSCWRVLSESELPEFLDEEKLMLG